MKKFNKISIIGVGLIGGSIGLALKKKKLAKEVAGICRRPVSLEKALDAKAIDWGTLDMQKGVSGADMVIVATGVDKITRMIKMAVPLVKPGCVFTDVGSVKAGIVKEVESFMPKNKYFVGSHPMAGSEKSGVKQARADLFKDAMTIVTKTGKTDVVALKAVKAFWSALGSKIKVVDPVKHDDLICQISHLPHIVAAAIAALPSSEAMEYASTGFFDTTRIASSDPELWSQISASNSKNLSRHIKKTIGILNELERLVDSKNRSALAGRLKKIKLKRDSGKIGG